MFLSRVFYDKYYFLIKSKKSAVILSSSRNKKPSKELAITKLYSKLDIIKKVNNVNNIKITLLSIKKVKKSEIIEHNNCSIDLIGGKLVIIIKTFIINLKNNIIYLKEKKESLSNCNKVFIDKKFLKKFNHVPDNLLKKITTKYNMNLIDGGFCINKLSRFI